MLHTDDKLNETLLLMKIIGLSNTHTLVPRDLNEDVLLNLLPLAVKNRVPLLYLGQCLNIRNGSKSLKTLYKVYLERSRVALNLAKEISRILVPNQVNYVFFKTFKPFPFVTVDLDILFFRREDLLSAYHSLLKARFKIADYGAYSISLYSPRYDMNIDLQLEISVSRLIYVNKELLQEYTREVDIDGDRIPVLETPAELIAVIAHSLYKEQMFTLSEYYSTIIHASRMTKQQLRNFVYLVEKTCVGLGVKTVLALVHFLTKVAFDKTLPAITRMEQMIEVDGFEKKTIPLTISHIVQNGKLPYKYHPVVVAVAFMTKFSKDPIMRGGLYKQFTEVVTNTSEFLESTLHHMRREAY